MKRTISILLLAFVVGMGIISCQEEPKEEPIESPSLTLNSSKTMSFQDSGGSQTVAFSCNRDWKVSSSESWITVSPSSGSANEEGVNVTISCEANASFEERNCTITVSSEGLSETITVTQDTNNAIIVSNPSSEFSNAAQTVSIIVQSNVQYEVDVAEAAQSWISHVSTKGLTESQVTLAIAENDGIAREGFVYIKYGNLQEAITIKQAEGFVRFADENFKAYCIEKYDSNKDGELSIGEAAIITIVGVSTENIESLKGIECMPNLSKLICPGGAEWGNNGKLKSLDVSKNTELTVLVCRHNQLTNLDVSNNPALVQLECDFNQLTSISFNNNPALSLLKCSNNQLSSLDFSKDIALGWLYCKSNLLQSIDVSGCERLQFFDCSYNQLTSLDVSNNIVLQNLICGNNLLTSLDVSNCTILQGLTCDNNQLTSLDVSNNTKIYALDCCDNPYLREIWLRKNQYITYFQYDKNIATIKYKD